MPHLLAKEGGKVTATGIAKLKAYVGKAQPKVTTSATKTTPKKGNVALTDEQIRMCSILKIDPEKHAEFLSGNGAMRIISPADLKTQHGAR